MQTKSERFSQRDWVLYAARWLIILLIAGAIIVLNDPNAAISAYMTSIVEAALINVVLLLILQGKGGGSTLSPAFFVADTLTLAAFAFNQVSDQRVTLMVASLLVVSALVRPDVQWNALQAISMLVISALSIVRTHGTINTHMVELLNLGLLAAAMVLTSYALDRWYGVLRRRIDALRIAEEEHNQDRQEYTRAISELTYTLGANLNYRKVLDAALSAGRLGLALPDREGSGLISAVFLFHSLDNKLHIASCRRFPRADEAKTLAGKQGIVAQALSEAIPVFGSDVRKDPELGFFMGLQYAKSLLCIPLRAGYDNFGVLIYASERPSAFTQDHIEVLTMVGIQTTLALQNSLLYHNLLTEKERIIDAEEEARKKLARDLHDGPIQGVAAIAMRAGYITKLVTKQPAQVPDELKKLEDLARQTTKDMRHMLFVLRPLVLETQGLRAALNQLADKMMEMHKQAVSVRVDGQIESVLDRQQQDVIFYISEEAVNNARKHAEASIISINITGESGMAVLEVADNGKGFDVGSVSGNYESRGSLGMINMRERAEMLDGTLDISSAPGKGTKITIIFPVYMHDTARLLKQNMTTKLAIAAAARVEGREDA